MILAQFIINMSSRRHDPLALHIRHTDILQPHHEYLEKNVFFLILLINIALFYMEISDSM